MDAGTATQFFLSFGVIKTGVKTHYCSRDKKRK
jgi:hypothetical protein